MPTPRPHDLTLVFAMGLGFLIAHTRLWPSLLLVFGVASLMEWRADPRKVIGPVGMLLVLAGAWSLFRFGIPGMAVALCVWLAFHASMRPAAGVATKGKPFVDVSLD